MGQIRLLISHTGFLKEETWAQCQTAGQIPHKSTTVTSAVRGLFRENVATRSEAMRFIGRD
jgi:GTP cyclohydrolase I